MMFVVRGELRCRATHHPTPDARGKASRLRRGRGLRNSIYDVVGSLRGNTARTECWACQVNTYTLYLPASRRPP